MKKALFLGVIFSLVVVLSGCAQQVTNQENDDMATEGAMEAVEDFNDIMADETITSQKIVKASCNVIVASSSCVDYIGDYWSNEEFAKLNCEGMGDMAEREFLTNTCPYTRYGGCKTGAGTIMEMVVWAYPEGGGEYDDENIQYAVMACNANPMGTWTTPDAEFLK